MSSPSIENPVSCSAKISEDIQSVSTATFILRFCDVPFIFFHLMLINQGGRLVYQTEGGKRKGIFKTVNRVFVENYL